ncbi:MAG TPA: HDIG domain-containing protein [bacterium]|nr:HDIG domain-containing protein [bacterium]HEX67981.1 HDIG domain-containing protein [bacterium]
MKGLRRKKKKTRKIGKGDKKTLKQKEKERNRAWWIIGVVLYIFLLFPLIYSCKGSIKTLWGKGIVLGLVLFLSLAFLYRYRKDSFPQPSYLSLFTLIVVFIYYLAWGSLKFFHHYFFLPLPLLGMVLTPFFGSGVSFVAVILVSFLISLINGLSWASFTYALIGGSVATLGISFTHRRMEVLRVGFVVGIFSALYLSAFGLVEGYKEKLWLIPSWGFLNGILWSMVTFGILPLLENISGMVTDAKLLELSDINHPLLQRLRREAPGTFQSSLMVGILAEAAAQAIGANPLLARVGAYYHDIGKLKNPQFYGENLSFFPRFRNIHDRVNPNLSALILTSHVKEGIHIGKQYKLPQAVLDIIAQHHGTTLTSFFYEKAKEIKGKEEVREEDFRYPGPKPMSKEAAIVMLADAVEAASRTLENPTTSRIRNLVERIINEKIQDGQLYDAPLSLKEIDLIKESFIRTLSSIFHTRVEYPQKNQGEKSDKGNS